MRKFKSTISLILLFIIITTLLSGCMDLSEDKMLAVCGSYASPGMFCSDLKGGNGAPFSIHIIEKDSEERILFLYETTNHISNEWDSVYVICQKIEEKYVYFYEDIGYMVADDNIDLEELKALNDWGMPLNAERMSRRPLKVSFDLFIMDDSELLFNEIKVAVCETLDVDTEEIKQLTRLDVNENGQELYWLSLGEERYEDCYLIMVNPNLEVAYTKADNNYRQQLAEFRKKGEWEG